jgi:hypothetical protein
VCSLLTPVITVPTLTRGAMMTASPSKGAQRMAMYGECFVCGCEFDTPHDLGMCDCFGMTKADYHASLLAAYHEEREESHFYHVYPHRHIKAQWLMGYPVERLGEDPPMHKLIHF